MATTVDNWIKAMVSGTSTDTYFQGGGPGTPPDGDHTLGISQLGAGGANRAGLYQLFYLEPGTEFTVSFWDYTTTECVGTVDTSTRVFNTDMNDTWQPATEAHFLTASPTDGWAVDTSTATWTQHTSPTLTSNGRVILSMYSDGYVQDWKGSRWDDWSLNIISQPVILDGDIDLDGDVDNVDIGAVFGAFTGPLPIPEDDPNRADLIYGPTSGYVILDATDAAGEAVKVDGGVITTWALETEDEFPNTFEPFFYPVDEPNDTFITNTPGQISQTLKTTQGFEGAWDLGNILPTGMDIYELRDYLSLARYTGELGTGNFDFDLLIGPDKTIPADIDRDGDVDNVDIGTLLGNYTGVPAGGMDLQVTPEPATLCLLSLGGAAMLRRRRQVNGQT